MQSDNAISIRFSDEFKQELYRLSKRFRNIRSDVQPIIEQLQQRNFVGDQSHCRHWGRVYCLQGESSQQ